MTSIEQSAAAMARYVGELEKEVQALRAERYEAVLAMRLAMGADHDGAHAMRSWLEPVVAKYGISTECMARAAVSEDVAKSVEARALCDAAMGGREQE